MKLVRYNPLNEMALFRNSLKNFFTDSIVKGESKSWYLAVDIINEGDSNVLNVDLPGVPKKDISVNLEEKVLIISGEKNQTKEKVKKINIHSSDDLKYKKGASQDRIKTAWDAPFCLTL